MRTTNKQPGHKAKDSLGQPRPTTNQILESLLATLAPDLEEAHVLDLFAGTGRVGLSCLKAGAHKVTMVEGHSRLARELKRKVPPTVDCLTLILPAGLDRCPGPYHVVLADPPYDQDCGPATLAKIAQLADRLLQPNAIICFEHHHKQAYPDCEGPLERYRVRRFGETQLSYYTWKVARPPTEFTVGRAREELPVLKRTAAHSLEE